MPRTLASLEKQLIKGELSPDECTKAEYLLRLIGDGSTKCIPYEAARDVKELCEEFGIQHKNLSNTEHHWCTRCGYCGKRLSPDLLSVIFFTFPRSVRVGDGCCDGHYYDVFEQSQTFDLLYYPPGSEMPVSAEAVISMSAERVKELDDELMHLIGCSEMPDDKEYELMKRVVDKPELAYELVLCETDFNELSKKEESKLVNDALQYAIKKSKYYAGAKFKELRKIGVKSLV